MPRVKHPAKLSTSFREFAWKQNELIYPAVEQLNLLSKKGVKRCVHPAWLGHTASDVLRNIAFTLMMMPVVLFLIAV